jgi:hypothetical protein
LGFITDLLDSLSSCGPYPERWRRQLGPGAQAEVAEDLGHHDEDEKEGDNPA